MASVNDLAHFALACHPRTVSVNASCQCILSDGHGQQVKVPLASLRWIRHLKIGGNGFEPADLDLSCLPSLTTLEVNTPYYPLKKVVYEAANLRALTLNGLQDIYFAPSSPFYHFLEQVSLSRLERLTLKDCSIHRFRGLRRLVFSSVRTLEIRSVRNAQALLSQDFPVVENVFFCSSRKGEIHSFLAGFVTRHAPHLRKILLRRCLETKYLLSGSQPCHALRHLEVINSAGVNALMACRLRIFALEGRVYFKPEDWNSFCSGPHVLSLEQVFLAPPNPLVKAEERYQVC